MKHHYYRTFIDSTPELLVDIFLFSLDSDDVDRFVIFFNQKVFFIRWLNELYLIVLSIVESIEVERRNNTCDQSIFIYIWYCKISVLVLLC